MLYIVSVCFHLDCAAGEDEKSHWHVFFTTQNEKNVKNDIKNVISALNTMLSNRNHSLGQMCDIVK